jgi:hypothetical protein
MITSIAAKVDPTSHFKGVPQSRLVEALGIVPSFVAYAAVEAPEVTARAVLDAMAEAYGFYMGDMEGGTVDAEGVYQYPDDPPLYPLVRWKLDDVTVYMYQYAIVAVQDKDTTIVTRMD